MNKIILQCDNLSKVYQDGHHAIEILKEINLQVEERQSIGIVGASGSGKSTFLHLLAGLDQATHGVIRWQGTDIQQLSEKQKCELRNRQLGFVYQFHHLLPEFDALENVAMPLLIGGEDPKKAAHEARELLQKIGLAKRTHHKIAELSGGERQRVAIARALVTKPQCVLADEPTGNLDEKTASQVLDVMLALQEEYSTSLMVVTHDMRIAKRLQLNYTLLDGHLNRL
jgi:lipoprotein-releasing system ATP-binding protein